MRFSVYEKLRDLSISYGFPQTIRILIKLLSGRLKSLRSSEVDMKRDDLPKRWIDRIHNYLSEKGSDYGKKYKRFSVYDFLV